MRQRPMPAVTDTITAAVQPRTRHRKRLLVLSILTIFVFTFITFTMYRVQKVDYHGSLHSFVEQLARGQLRSSDSVDDVGLLRILEPFAVCEAGWTDASCVLENEQDPAYLPTAALDPSTSLTALCSGAPCVGLAALRRDAFVLHALQHG